MKNKLSLLVIAALVVLAGCTTQPHRATSSVEATSTSRVVAEAEAVAPAKAAAPRAQSESGNRLGTRWGEGLSSQVTVIDATRINPDRPDGVGTVYYDGKNTRATPSNPGVLTMPLAGGRVEFAILDAGGDKMPLYRLRDGKLHLSGRDGDRYQLSFTNLGNTPYEIVATVDGLDVISGQPGRMDSGGYVLQPGRSVKIQGFRKDRNEVAAFRFSAVADAYASNTPAGSPRNTGVIGVAIFALALGEPDARTSDQSDTSRPNAFPGEPAQDKSFAPPPRYRN